MEDLEVITLELEQIKYMLYLIDNKMKHLLTLNGVVVIDDDNKIDVCELN